MTPALHAQGRSPVPPASPIKAELIIPDAENLLPGVPFEMWIEVRNPSDATVGLGLCADMLVRTEDGESFEIIFGGENRRPYPTLLPEERWNGAMVSNLIMRPRQTQTLTLPLLPRLSGPIYFDDHRVSEAGRYQISLRLDYCWPGFVTPQKSLLPPEFLGHVTTNEVAVVRATWSDSDAAVWNRMQELTGGNWDATSLMVIKHGPTVANEIVTKYPDSNYFPYALLAASFGAVDETAYNRVVDAIARFPDSPVREVLQVLARGTAGKARKPAHVLNAHLAKIRESNRPTTRMLYSGREDLPKEPDAPSASPITARLVIPVCRSTCESSFGIHLTAPSPLVCSPSCSYAGTGASRLQGGATNLAGDLDEVLRLQLRAKRSAGQSWHRRGVPEECLGRDRTVP